MPNITPSSHKPFENIPLIVFTSSTTSHSEVKEETDEHIVEERMSFTTKPNEQCNTLVLHSATESQDSSATLIARVSQDTPPEVGSCLFGHLPCTKLQWALIANCAGSSFVFFTSYTLSIIQEDKDNAASLSDASDWFKAFFSIMIISGSSSLLSISVLLFMLTHWSYRRFCSNTSWLSITNAVDQECYLSSSDTSEFVDNNNPRQALLPINHAFTSAKDATSYGSANYS